MKRIKYLLLGLVVSAFVFQSCSEDKMDDINIDKNNPVDVEAKYILTDMIVKSAFSTTGSDLAFYTAIYTELLGGSWNQMYNAQIRESEPVMASTYNNSWNTIYHTLRDLNKVIEKCSEGGLEAGNYHTLGVAQVLKAYNLAILTDLFGDVPYHDSAEVGSSIRELSSQESIYAMVFSLLDSGIENLGKTSTYPSLGAHDLIFRGGTNSWIETAYGLKARYKMRLSVVEPNYEEVLTNLDKSFSNEEIDFRLEDPKVPYPFYTFAMQRKGLTSSQTYYNVMVDNDKNDPRIEDYFVPFVEKDDNGNIISSEVILLDASKDVIQSTTAYSPSGLSNTVLVQNSLNAIYLLSYHELMFIKAEAHARLGQDALAIKALKGGIKASLNQKQSFIYPDYEYPVDGNLTGDALLKKIAQAKYLSFIEVEAVEAFNDIRRWKAMGEEWIPLRNSKPERFPLRLTYGESDVVNNPFVTKAFGDGTYVYTENVWWAGGTR